MFQNPLAEQLQKEIDGIAPKSDSKGLPFWKFDPTASRTYYYRPLPSKMAGKLLPVEEIKVHYNFYNPNTEKNGAFPCLTQYGMHCPLCDAVKMMRQNPDPEIQAKADDCEAGGSHFMYVLDPQKNEIGVLTFGGKRAFESITGKFKELIVETQSNGTDLNNGVIFQIDKTGAKLTTQYKTMICQRNNQVPADLVAIFNDLPQLNLVYGEYNTEIYHKVLNGHKFDLPGFNNTNAAPKNPNQAFLPPAQPAFQPQQPTQQFQQPAQHQQFQQPAQNFQQQMVGPGTVNPTAPTQQFQQPVQPTQQQFQQPVQPQQPAPQFAPQQPVQPQSFPNPNANTAPQPSIEDLQRMLGGGQK